MTIVAENSTMASVLAGVRSCIGVQIELPGGSLDARAYIQLGPGPVRQVLESLLSSTDFNYVIQSSDTDPQKIQTVLLMARAAEPRELANPSGLVLTPARRAWLESRRNGRPAEPVRNESNSDDVEAANSIAPEEPAAPAAAPDADAAAQKPAAEPIGNDAAQTSAKAPAAAASPADSATAAPLQASPAPPSTAEPAAPPTPAAQPDQEPPAADSSTPAAKEIENKINSMQQLFEQRRQMIANQGSTPPQTTPPQN
jgi:chemotaxis protein histidine kinase CheA